MSVNFLIDSGEKSVDILSVNHYFLWTILRTLFSELTVEDGMA
jgi:hypothetical protein